MTYDLVFPEIHDFTVVSVDVRALTEETKNQIAEHQTWIDVDDQLAENIYDLDFDEEELKNPQIREIWETCEKRKAAYFRLVDM